MIMELIPWTFIQHKDFALNQSGFNGEEKSGSSFKATFSTVYQLRSGPSIGYTSPSQCDWLQTCHFKWQQQVIWICFLPRYSCEYAGVLFLGEHFFWPNKHLHLYPQKNTAIPDTVFAFQKKITLGEEMMTFSRILSFKDSAGGWDCWYI